jgi:hypothetical protein
LHLNHHQTEIENIEQPRKKKVCLYIFQRIFEENKNVLPSIFVQTKIAPLVNLNRPTPKFKQHQLDKKILLRIGDRLQSY